jgi:hyperosmotically inducible periplasmic protein
MRNRATSHAWSAVCAFAVAIILPAHADESPLASKIKARLATQYYSSTLHIQVKTDADGIVWLTGTAATSDACSLAAEIAKNTDGVTAVHNEIRVR